MAKQHRKYYKIPTWVVTKKPWLSPLIQWIKGLWVWLKDETCSISLKYLTKKLQCISELSHKELKIFVKLIHKVQKMNWNEIIADRWLKYTEVDISKYKGCVSSEFLNQITQEAKFSEMRWSKWFRVHWFKIWPVRFLVLLDKNHEICK